MVLFKNALLADGTHTDILTDNGKIIDITSHIDIKCHTIDCEGRLLLPGMIDVHVHFRDPGLTHKEDALTGTRAALRGGVTSIIDMPNTLPLCTTINALTEKQAIYRHKALCNYGFHFGADARNNTAEIQKAVGFASLKIFLNESTGHMLIEDDTLLDKLFQVAPIISVHAEGDAVEKALFFARKHKKKLYLCHISQEEEIITIKKAKAAGQVVFAEACPHHVLFNDTAQTPLLTMKPNLRSERNRQQLLNALDEGIIDTWGTDHAPHLESEKLTKTTYGVEGIEFALEILLTLAKDMNWPFEKVQQLYSFRPAQIFGIRNKGQILKGQDADFCLVDHQASYVISTSDIESKANWSPYIDRRLDAKIHSTYIGGELSYYNKQFFRSHYIQELTYE